MSEKTTLDILREDIVIPEHVQQRADAAFAKIKAEAPGQKIVRLNRGRGRKNCRSWAAAAAVAVLCLSTVTAGAAYLKWSSGLEKDLAVTKEQKEEAESTGLAGFPNLSVKDKGITITAQQSIVDNYYGYLAFKVEGFKAGAGKEPAFDELDIKIDGKDTSFVHEVYGGKTVGEDGNFEYHIQLYGDGHEGSLMDKDIKVQFKGLGIAREKAGKAEDTVDGNWEFKWRMTGSDEIYTAKVNEKLGDSGATVTGAEVSPISVKAEYDFPYQTEKEKAFDETKGTAYETDMPKEPPLLAGVKLKDGTLVMSTQGGRLGYTDGGIKEYEESFAMGRILDVDEVESLLFVKKAPEEERPLTEDDLYIVKIR